MTLDLSTATRQHVTRWKQVFSDSFLVRLWQSVKLADEPYPCSPALAKLVKYLLQFASPAECTGEFT